MISEQNPMYRMQSPQNRLNKLPANVPHGASFLKPTAASKAKLWNVIDPERFKKDPLDFGARNDDVTFFNRDLFST